MVIGQEAAGVVTEVGAEVANLKPGDHVAYRGVHGSYAEYAAVPADKLVRIPKGISDEQAAAAMLQGMTAQYLCYSTYPVKRGDTVLVHAAAGGVGLLLVQMCHHLGARVIGTVSTPQKAALAREAGADEVILYSQVDFEVGDAPPDRQQGRACDLRRRRRGNVFKRAEPAAAPRPHGQLRSGQRLRCRRSTPWC